MNTPKTTAARPIIDTVNLQGLPELRPARVVSELPTPELRQAALLEATGAISEKIGIKSIRPLKLLVPVFSAYEGMTRQKSKHHPDEALLLTHGCDVSLDFCPSYEQSSSPAPEAPEQSHASVVPVQPIGPRAAWNRLYAARIAERSGWDLANAMDAAEAADDPFNDGDEPAQAADEEMSCWTD